MGRGDSFAATDADNAFIAAETDLLTSRSQVCLAGYRLLRAMGTLTETPDALKPKPLELPP
jgi:outer membrane protein TolC